MSNHNEACIDDYIDSTADLMHRVRSGDSQAREDLFRHYLPLLQRWAYGRRSWVSTGGVDTDDLIQITLLRAFSRLAHFIPQNNGSFMAYLRQIFLNEVLAERRKAAKAPLTCEVTDNLFDEKLNVVDQLIEREILLQYQQSLTQLPCQQQRILAMRIERKMSYSAIAIQIKSTAEAARKATMRATAFMTRLMSNQHVSRTSCKSPAVRRFS